MEGDMDEFFSISIEDKAVEEIFDAEDIIITEDDILKIEEPDFLFLYDIEYGEYEKEL